MSGWTRTVKPSVLGKGVSGKVYGVDVAEVAATPGVAQDGWVYRRTVGSRVLHETLVAMHTPPTEDNADDVLFPDALITITEQPTDQNSQLPDGAGFGVVATITPVVAPTDTGLAYIAYQWQESTDAGDTWSNLSNAGVYTGVDESLLVISDATGLDGYMYRCLLDGPYTAAVQKISDEVTLTVLPEPTVAPTTDAPTTLAPTTLAPTTTEAPTTVAPTTTEAPTTLAPTTVAPTAAPTTVAPTAAPTTSTTQSPVATTLAPTTLAPTTTAAPTTAAPTTTTVAPTVAPTTLAPTTIAPTTDAPTTLAPTTTVAPTTTLAPTTTTMSI